MVKKLAAALIALSLPGTAAAWEWGTAPGGNLDLYYTPYLTEDSGGATDRGDGYGVRGTFKVHQMVSVLVEHDEYSLDSGDDGRESALGVGATLPSGTGLFLEYARGDGYDGYGARGRLMAMMLPDVQVYADLGWRSNKGDGQIEFDSMFYSAGASFAISNQWGFFADYRIVDSSDLDTEFSMTRLGVNIRLDY